MDEAQDNHEEQALILNRIFSAGASPVIRQRFGDANQAIFNGFDHVDAASTDPFPGSSVIQLHSSPRFGPVLAKLADPLGLIRIPQGLTGCGPKTKLDSGNAAKHTLFLFNDKSVHRVLDAYGQLLVETFSDRELREGVFTAVGQVHRVPEVECAKHYPHHVGHCWPEYMPELNSRDPKPKTFVQCLLAALAASHLHGESFAAVDHIAAGVLHLAGLPGNLTSGRRHAAVCGALRANNEALRAYRRLIAIFAIRREAITAEAWRDSGAVSFR